MPNSGREDEGTENRPDNIHTGVPHAVFSVDRAPPKARYEIWHDSISCIFEVDAAPPLRDGAFSASVDAHMLGQVMLARTRTMEQTWTRSPAIAARDGMDHYMIQLFEAGHMMATHRHGETELPRNGLIVFDLAESMASRTNDFTNLSLILPRPMLEGLLKDPDGQHMRTLPADNPMAAMLRDHMLSLKRQAGRLTNEQALEIVPATAAMVAACLNGSMEDLPLGDGRPTLRDGTAMARCKRFIDANLPDPDLAPETVASAVGLSRSRLYHLFRDRGGVASYIRERRLRAALLALGDPRQSHHSIYDIALAHGFTSNATFTRMFGQRYGMRPRDVRRGHAAGGINPESAGDTGIDRRYEGWLNRLIS